MLKSVFKRRALAFVIVFMMMAQLFTLLPFTAAAEAPAGEEPVTVERRMTPIMGWASWNKYNVQISETLLRQQIDALVSTGLADAGYTYFNIDDGFQGGRDPETGLVRNHPVRFPNGLKVIADYAHSKGLKAGIYTDAGENTCASVSHGEGANGSGYGLGVGLYGYDEQDLRMFLVDWGFDFIKVDWCGGRDFKPQALNKQERYTAIGRVINEIEQEIGQDKIYNICCWSFPGEWAVDVADSWRTGGDISPNFSSVLYQIDQIKSLAKYNGPGHVNDLDMMQVGNGMSYEEDKSHFSLWCMMSTPLVLGNDLTTISEQTLGILTNEEMIALNQDPACIQATVAKAQGNAEVWVKPLGSADSTTKAVALLNRGTQPMEITVDWKKDVGLSNVGMARDLWLHQDIPVRDQYTVTVPAHGIVVLKVSGEEELGSDLLKSELSAKPATVDLSAQGNVDWSYFGASEVKNATNIIGSYTASEGAQLTTYDNSGTTYSWQDGKSTASGTAAKGFKLTGENVSVELNIPASELAKTARLYFGGSDATIKVTATLNGKETTEYVQAAGGMGGVYQVEYSSKTGGDLQLKISAEGTGSVNLEAVTIQSSVAYTATTTVSNKPANVSMTQLGQSDWAYFGPYSNITGHYKKDGGRTISLKNGGTSSGTYTNAVTSYSWTDGDAVTTNTGSKSGIGYRDQGAFFEVTAPAGNIERTLSVFVGGYQSTILVEVFVADSLVHSETIENPTGKVDRMVQLTYSTTQPSTARVRWTVVTEYNNNGSVSAEGAAITAASAETPMVYATQRVLTESAVDLDTRGTLDWITFDGANGNVGGQKADAAYLTDFVTKEGTAVVSADSSIQYVGAGASHNKGAAQVNDRGYFEVFAPASELQLRRMDLYIGMTNVKVDVFAAVGATSTKLSSYDIENGQNTVISVWYRGSQDLSVRLEVQNLFAQDSALRIDAVTLSDEQNNILSYPVVTQQDNVLSMRTSLLQVDEQGFDSAAWIAAIYDENDMFRGMTRKEIALQKGTWSEVDSSIDIPADITRGFVRLYLWDDDTASNAPLNEAYLYEIPFEAKVDNDDLSLIGGLTAKSMVAKGAILVDVRSAAEYAQGHIEGSINISHLDILEKASALLPDRDASIIVYCATAKRSTQAQQLLTYMGYTKVYNLGNMSSWYLQPTITLPTLSSARMYEPTMLLQPVMTVNQYDNAELYYSYGESSTFADAVKSTNGSIPLGTDGWVKAYVVFDGQVYAETAKQYNAYQAQPIPTVTPNIYASDMTWISSTNGWGTLRRDRSVDNNPLRIGGHAFTKGIGAHASSTIKMAIPTGADRFIAVAGCDDEARGQSSWPGFTYTQYSILIDGVLIEKSLELNAGMYHVFDIAIPEGAQVIELIADETADGNGYDHSDWGIAGFCYKIATE